MDSKELSSNKDVNMKGAHFLWNLEAGIEDIAKEAAKVWARRKVTRKLVGLKV